MVVPSTPDQEICVRVLARDIVFFPWALYSLTSCINGHWRIQCWGEPCDALAPPLLGLEIFLVSSWYRNQDKTRPDGPFSSYADYSFFYLPTTENLSRTIVQQFVLLYVQGTTRSNNVRRCKCRPEYCIFTSGLQKAG